MTAALARVFGAAPVPSPTTASATIPDRQATASIEEDPLARAAELYERAENALLRGDLQAYAREIEELGRVLKDAQRR
jgi:hypothetical protein